MGCNWYDLTLKFEVEIIQSIPLVILPGCPMSLSWYSLPSKLSKNPRGIWLQKCLLPNSRQKRNLLVNLISSQQASFPLQCSFCCYHTVSLLNTGSEQFVNLCLLLTAVPSQVHNSTRAEATMEEGQLIHTVLWRLPPWEPKQGRAVCHKLVPNSRPPGCLA